MIDTIFLDMDGVIADFVGAILTAAGYSVKDCKVGEWDLRKALPALNDRAFNDFCSRQEFWAALAQTDEAAAIVCSCLKSQRQVAVITDPGEWSEAVNGKKAWISKHFPELRDSLIFTGAKHLCASPRALLIDDNPKHVQAFRARGGAGILVPRIWNHRHDLAPLCVSVVLQEIRRAL